MKISTDVNDLTLHYFGNLIAEDITDTLLVKYHSGLGVWNKKLLIAVVTFPSSTTSVVTWINDSSKISGMTGETKADLRVSITSKLKESLFFKNLAFDHKPLLLGKVFYLTGRTSKGKLLKRSSRGMLKSRLTVFSLLPDWQSEGKTIKDITNGMKLLGVVVSRATVGSILKDMHKLKVVTRSKASDGVSWMYFKEPTVDATRFLSIYSSVV